MFRDSSQLLPAKATLNFEAALVSWPWQKAIPFLAQANFPLITAMSSGRLRFVPAHHCLGKKSIKTQLARKENGLVIQTFIKH